VKSWVSYENVVILLYHLRVNEKTIVSILVWVKTTITVDEVVVIFFFLCDKKM